MSTQHTTAALSFFGIGQTFSVAVNVEEFPTQVAFDLFDALARRLLSQETLDRYTPEFTAMYAEIQRNIIDERKGNK